ncbi:MAG: hypothetical protein V1837_03955 [Candidatus Woesearchaeota archaeon]
MRSVVIEEGALLGILTSAVEVYDKETCGILIGRRKGNSYVIKYAITHQTAERKKKEITVDDKYEKRINRTNCLISKYSRVGDYHSHIGKLDGLTDCDKKSLKIDGEGVSLLILIKKARKERKWQYKAQEKKISGSIGSDYTISIKAYYYDHIKKRIHKISLKCPYINTLNRIN